MKLLNQIPSAGLGKFDIAYTPSSSDLAVTVELHFSFTDDASADFAVKVHKSTGPGIDYQSVGHNEHLPDPTKQPTANCRQSDNQENPDFRTTTVATTERKRIQAVITAAVRRSGPVRAQKHELTPAGAAALAQLSTALDAASPSAADPADRRAVRQRRRSGD